ncbi:Ig-like domain-containing protein [Microcella alkalica]|uniref:Ig-like domain-containing protein n=1 Tax=Microcella alkalica TaxID=355930 RepID=UPI00145F21BA|nr:Ig-like domain-containing protein [Microcella alkalica]
MRARPSVSAGPRRASPLGIIARVALVAATLGLALGATAGPAAATVDPTPSPEPTPFSAVAASFTSPQSGFVGSAAITVAGEKDATSGVRVAIVGGGTVCEAEPGPTTWSCSDVALPTGGVELAGVEVLVDGTERPFGSVQLRVLPPPRIDGAGAATLTAGRFTGIAAPGADVEVRTVDERGAVVHSCPAALPDGFWSCIVQVPSGDYRVSARQQVDAIGPERSDWSGATLATVDREVPPAPSIDFPRSGTRTASSTLRVAGTAEPGASLQLFASGDIVCEARVDARGTWECRIELPQPGELELRALSRDGAGNFSSASDGVRIEWAVPGETGGATPSSPPGDDPDAERPGQPSPGATEGASPGAHGDPRAPGGSPTPGAPTPGDGGPTAPPQRGQPELSTNWGTPTGFGGALPTAAQIVERGGLVAAPLIALGYLLLVALPLRWFATHALPRIRLALPRLTGRNRGVVADDDGPVVSPVLTTIGVFAGAALIAGVEGGLDLEVRYARLTAAIGLGMLLLAGVGIALPASVVRRATGASVVVRLLPGILAVAAGAALLTRVAELRPGILIGVLVAASVIGAARFRVRVALAVAQLAAVAALALLGWAVHDLLTPSSGFWVSFTAETAAAVALGGLGSLLVMLLPVGAFPGRAVYAVSRALWVIAALAAASVTGAIVASGASFPLVPLALAAAGVGAVLVGATVWVRWVEPALD